MPRHIPAPGAAAPRALRHTVLFPNGAAARARTRNIRGPSHTAPAPDDDEPTHLRPMFAVAHSARRGTSPPGPRAAADPVAPGTIIGNYRVIEPLANGGMGVVFLGEHIHLGRKVALKFLHQRLVGDSWAVSRFFAEAVAAARISHPGTVSIFDYGSFEGGAYLVMEYLRGETLSARLDRERRLPVARVVDIGMQLALTLAAAHEAGVIHRDLKPENVHLVPDPGGSGYEYVKVLDFGVAKLSVGSCVPQTQRGDLLGTPFYMAPEQSVHAGTVDHRCDIYSLGCLLYQLVSGTVPFRGSMLEILVAHQTEPALALSSFDRSIPPALEALILHMMAKSPDGRPSSMVEVLRALQSIEREERTGTAPRPTRRRSAAWLGLCFGVGLSIAGLGYLATTW